MIVTLSEVKTYLRIDQDFTGEDSFLNDLIAASELYLKNATGKIFDNTNPIAKLLCRIIIADWYTNRNFSNTTFSDKVKYTVSSMMLQLEYCDDGDVT